MIKAFRTYIQPIVQYGVLIYGSTTITTIREIDKVVKRIVRLIFHRKMFESTYEERVKHRIFLELHAYEVLKQTLKNIRGQCNISPISKGFSMQNCLKKSKRLIKNKITQCKNLFHSFSITNRIKLVLRMLLGYDDEIIEKIESMSTAETKNFCHQFLDNYILVMRTQSDCCMSFNITTQRRSITRIMFFTRFNGTLKNSASSFFSFFILNHFHPDKLNETLENGPSAQQCSPTVKHVIVFAQVIVKSYLLTDGNNLLSLLL